LTGSPRRPTRAAPAWRSWSLPAAALAVAGLLAVLLPHPLAGHDLSLTETRVTFPGDGTFEIEMVLDLDALALGAPRGGDSDRLAARLATLPPDRLADTVADLEELFRRRVRVRFDGTPVGFAVAFPERAATAVVRRGGPTVLGTIAVLTGTIPEGGREFSFFASRVFPPVELVVNGPLGAELYRELVPPGARSSPLDLEDLPPPPGAWRIASRYWILGFEHIVPKGLDHILFVLGLFLLSAHLRPLLLQVTAFTAAHTLTLALASLDVVTLPAAVVEPLIALSIVYVAVENVVTRELKPWRPALVFVFGLLHGLGFARVVGELGLPRGQLLSALLGFNVGVELGQLAVLATAFTVLGVFVRKPWYRPRIAIPLSLVIAAVGLFWVWQRVWG